MKKISYLIISLFIIGCASVDEGNIEEYELFQGMNRDDARAVFYSVTFGQDPFLGSMYYYSDLDIEIVTNETDTLSLVFTNVYRSCEDIGYSCSRGNFSKKFFSPNEGSLALAQSYIFDIREENRAKELAREREEEREREERARLAREREEERERERIAAREKKCGLLNNQIPLSNRIKNAPVVDRSQIFIAFMPIHTIDSAGNVPENFTCDSYRKILVLDAVNMKAEFLSSFSLGDDTIQCTFAFCLQPDNPNIEKTSLQKEKLKVERTDDLSKYIITRGPFTGKKNVLELGIEILLSLDYDIDEDYYFYEVWEVPIASHGVITYYHESNGSRRYGSTRSFEFRIVDKSYLLHREREVRAEVNRLITLRRETLENNLF